MEIVENHEAAIKGGLPIGAEGGAIVLVVAGKEVVVKGSDAGEVKEGASTSAVEGGGRIFRGGEAVAIAVCAGEVEAGEESLERRVSVNEGRDVAGAILDGGAEAEQEDSE